MPTTAEQQHAIKARIEILTRTILSGKLSAEDRQGILAKIDVELDRYNALKEKA